MPHLIVVRDVLRGGREVHDLELGTRLAGELMRLYPEGLAGPWQVYKGEALEECEIAATNISDALVEDCDYVLVVRPLGPAIAAINLWDIFWAFVVSAVVGVISYFLTPKQKKSTEEENKESPNNSLAGQSNQLRAGARVPDILGKVRSYPDLLLPPLEVWTRRRQEITEFFVIGVGDYDVQDPKLGETPILGMEGVSPPTIYLPNDDLPPMKCIRISPEVNQLSLITQDDAQAPIVGATFTAPDTMSLPTYLAVSVGQFIAISGTLNNSKTFTVTAVPLVTQTVGPFVYKLGGTAVTNESPANPSFSILAARYELACYILGNWGTTTATLWNLTIEPVIGDLLVLDSTGSGGSLVWTGYITSATSYTDGGDWYTEIRMTDLNGAPVVFANPGGSQYCRYTEYSSDPAEGGGDEPDAPNENEYSGWFTAPMQDPDEIWIDVAFPQGLVQYYQSKRREMTVSVRAEFRRLGATDPQDNRGYTYVQSSTGPMRWTHLVTVGELTGLPSSASSSPYIQVRLRRTTEFKPDDANYQYVQETVWARLAAIRLVKSRKYPDVTIAGLGLVNTHSAASIGENSFNVIVTRVLPRWTPTGWTSPLTTEKWADNLVQRMKAKDGANKLDSEIDLAGIYAIQTTLDGMDGNSGEQGQISLTLDQQQDIDAELQTIAQLVRGTVYRIGRKLYVTRDQGGKTPLALFTGRSKHPDGEQLNITFKNDSEPDAVIVQWFDRTNGWKLREYQFPEPSVVTPLNEFRVTPPFANWAQAWRRSQYEWNRIRLRREALNLQATDEARLLHIGDVINVTDDIANLAQSAGEVIAVNGLTLELDLPVNVSAGGFTIMLRAQNGRTLDTIPVTAGADAHHVVLSRAPAFAIKGRDDNLGTIYAIYQTATAVVRPWLVSSLQPQDTYTRIVAANWREDVYAGDAGAIPGVPVLLPTMRNPRDVIAARESA